MTDQLLPLHTFKRQFDFRPEIMNAKNSSHKETIIVGMGGSAICVNLLKMLFPELKVSLHNSYGLPSSYDPKSTHIILNSYSGNTEEVLDALDRALKDKAAISLLSQGGELLKRGKEEKLPYIAIPENDLEPRFSIGYQLIGLLTLMNEPEKMRMLREKVDLLHIDSCEEAGKALAERIGTTYPVIYASSQFYPVAYLIKAAINEGAKVPSFVNQIPEANHNELQSFVTDDSRDEHERFSFLFLRSHYDHQRIGKRFETMEALYTEKKFSVLTLMKDATNITEIFETIITGYFIASYMAINRNVDPYKTPFIKEFKSEMKK